jgi:hypothetical protein
MHVGWLMLIDRSIELKFGGVLEVVGIEEVSTVPWRIFWGNRSLLVL